MGNLESVPPPKQACFNFFLRAARKKIKANNIFVRPTPLIFPYVCLLFNHVDLCFWTRFKSWSTTEAFSSPCLAYPSCTLWTARWGAYPKTEDLIVFGATPCFVYEDVGGLWLNMYIRLYQIYPYYVHCQLMCFGEAVLYVLIQIKWSSWHLNLSNEHQDVNKLHTTTHVSNYL